MILCLFHFADEKENECYELLTEIINNQTSNSSIDALRESFLNREGILSLKRMAEIGSKEKDTMYY